MTTRWCQAPLRPRSLLSPFTGVLVCQGLLQLQSYVNISTVQKCTKDAVWLTHTLLFASSLFFTRSVMSDSVSPWTAARQASLSITSSPNLLKLMSIESVVLSNHLILRCPLLLPPSIFPSLSVFSNLFFASGGQSIGVSASKSVLPMNIQDWFPLGWTGWISLRSKGLSRVFSNTTVQKHQFFGDQICF